MNGCLSSYKQQIHFVLFVFALVETDPILTDIEQELHTTLKKAFTLI